MSSRRWRCFQKSFHRSPERLSLSNIVSMFRFSGRSLAQVVFFALTGVETGAAEGPQGIWSSKRFPARILNRVEEHRSFFGGCSSFVFERNHFRQVALHPLTHRSRKQTNLFIGIFPALAT